MRQTAKPFVRTAAEPSDSTKRKKLPPEQDETPWDERETVEAPPVSKKDLEEDPTEQRTQEEDFSELVDEEGKPQPSREINEDMTLEDVVDQVGEDGGFLDKEAFDDAIKFREGDYTSPVQYQPVNAPAVSKIRQEQEEKAKQEDKQGEEEKPQDEEEKKKPSDAVDPAALGGRSDGQVLADAKAVAIDIHNFSAKAEKDAVEAQRQVEALLQGNEGQNLKSAIEALQPGSTKSDNPEEKSVFDKIANDILEIFSGWNIVISEKKKQGRMYGEILHKLRRPQFRLPAWLESLSTGTSAKVINETRRKRFDQARDNFLQSKTPMSNAQKRDFNMAMQRRVDKLQANQQVINRFFDQQGAVKFLKEYNHNKGLRQAMDGALMPLLVDTEEKKVYDQQDIPPAVVQQVKQNLQKAVRNFESKSKKDLELTPDQLGLFVDHYLKNRGKALQVIKSELGEDEQSSDEKAASSISPFTRFAQVAETTSTEETPVAEGPSEESVSPEGPTPEQNRAAATVKKYLEKLNQIIEERIGKAEAAQVDEGDESTAIFNAYARITSMYFDPNFAPSLAALGYKWMEEHPEGSKQNYLIVESTREGDGEKLLTVFDPKTGAGSRAVKMIGDFVKHMAVPGLNQAMYDFEQLAGVSTSHTQERNEKMFGEDSDGDGVSDESEANGFKRLLEQFVEENKSKTVELQEDLKDVEEPSEEEAQQATEQVGLRLVNHAVETAYNEVKDLDSVDEQHRGVQTRLDELAKEKIPTPYQQSVTETVESLNAVMRTNGFPEFEFASSATPTEEPEEVEVEEEVEEKQDLQSQTINFAEKALTLVQQMKQAAEAFAATTTPADRLKAMNAYFGALQQIGKQYRPIIQAVQTLNEQQSSEEPPPKTSRLQGFTRFAIKPAEYFGRPGGYKAFAEELEDALDLVIKNRDAELTTTIYETLDRALAPQRVKQMLRIPGPGGMNLYDKSTYEQYLQTIEEQYGGQIPDANVKNTEQVVATLTELAIESFAEAYSKLSGESLTSQQVVEDEGMSNYISKFDDAIKAEEPETKSEEELQQLQENIKQQAEEFAKEYFEKEKVNPDDEEESAEALGENNPQDNPGQEPKNEDGTPIKPEDTDTQAGATQRTIKSRIDVDRANRLIALRKIQRAVINR